MTYAYKAVRMSHQQKECLRAIIDREPLRQWPLHTQRALIRKGLIERTDSWWVLTPAGQREALRLGYAAGQEG